MRKIIIISILFWGSYQGFSQTGFEPVLKEIESHNTTLQTLKAKAETQKVSNRTGIYLSNPEAEVNYLWGSPVDIENRTDFNIKQSFDFPTAYHYKSAIADGRNTQADMEYLWQRQNILLEASKICADIIYANALKTEWDKRLQHAQALVEAYQSRFDKGDVNILDLNKAKLNLLNARKASESNNIERKALQTELVRLNGGQPISLEYSVYTSPNLAPDFAQWYQNIVKNNLELQIISKDIELSKQQQKLNRAMSLPKFSAGYMSERTASTTLQGLSVGVSIPLWENKNTVKSEKLQTQALETSAHDAQISFYNTLQMQYNKALSLQNLVKDYKDILQTVDDRELLKKALDQGQISLIEYLTELSIYYETITNVLTAERDLQYVTSELKQWER